MEKKRVAVGKWVKLLGVHASLVHRSSGAESYQVGSGASEAR